MGYAFTIVRGWAFKTTTRSTFRSTEHSIGFRFYTLSSHSKFTNRNSHLVSFELRFFISSEITGSFTEMDTQWRKELLSRRKKLAEQAGQQLTGLGLKLNEVTGYKEVERLKELVEEKGESL
jgi:hypothetical protein